MKNLVSPEALLQVFGRSKRSLTWVFIMNTEFSFMKRI